LSGRGFQIGPSNPGAQWAARVVGRAGRRANAAKSRTATARAAAPLGGFGLAPGGVRGALSTREAAVALDLYSKHGVTQTVAGAAVGVSQSAVSRLVVRKRAADAAGAAGDARLEQQLNPCATAKRRRTGRPTLLDESATARVHFSVAEDPFGNVEDWLAALEKKGLAVSRPSLYRWLAKLKIESRATNNYAHLSESLIHGLLNHVEAMQAAFASGELTHEHVAYADQTPIFIRTGHNGAMGATIVFGECGDHKGGTMIGSLWAVVTCRGVLRAWLTEKNGGEESAEEFFLSDSMPDGWTHIYGEEGNIFDLIAAHGKTLRGRNKKMVLCIDRLGKSGSSVYAVAGHHRPSFRVRARQVGVGLLMLPPKGALVNPIELWNAHVKWLMLRWQPDGAPSDTWGQLVRGPRTKEEGLAALRSAVAQSDKEPSALRAAYHARADGAKLLVRLEKSKDAAKVRAERAAAPEAPFSVYEVASAPRCRMSTQHEHPRSAGMSETYNVYWYLHQLHNLHEGLPPPWRRKVDDDGKEQSCRLCKPATVAARKRDPLCLVCDTCPGVFHFECCGLAKRPKGAWQCAGCARGEKVTPRVWTAPKKVDKAPRKPRAKRQGGRGRKEASDSDDDE